MRQFFKFMFASMLGTFLTLLIVFFISIGIIASLVSFAGDKETTVVKNTVLRLKFDMPVSDRTPVETFNFSALQNANVPGLNDILKNIRKAKNDPNISGILLDLSFIPAGISTVEEIRNALVDFKTSGKFLYSYSETYTQKTYYLASISDKIFMNSEGSLDFKGVSAQIFFMKGTLEKLDIEMQVIRHGKFKSAVEPFVSDKMSEANREQTLKYVSGIWDNMLLGISQSRKINVEELNRIADQLQIRLPEDAVKCKLIDKLVYKDELLDELRTKLGLQKDEKINFMSLNKYQNAPETEKKKTSKDKIAIIYASGSITGGEGDDQTIGSERVSKAIREARLDKMVKAIVLRINSPGGSALASEVIWREVELAKKVKPVIASMGDVAASGGYYIACNANKIFASPTTLTGSIGVFGMIPNLQKFFNNKLGITFDGVKTNPYADFISPNRALTPYEQGAIQQEIEHIYATFVRHVAEGRKLTTARVDSIGQGRIWCGTDAKNINLVDAIGGLDDAIKEAAKMAKLGNYRLLNLPRQKDALTRIVEEISGGYEESRIKANLGEYYTYYSYLKSLKEYSGVQARLPYAINIR
ncbi:MAG: signal peptide peptidase SppA [Lentimicrobiaceae bacterium]|nr:signal peptide peptidase SppA [Lentimicrobiaceae bacterium]